MPRRSTPPLSNAGGAFRTDMTPEQFFALLPAGQLWVFGYGSLMWSPGFPFLEKSPGRVHGYHRALCVLSHRYRGTPERPGLVMGLCHGGSCWGMTFRVSIGRTRRVLATLWHREMRNLVYVPRHVPVRLEDGRRVNALTFVADAGHRQFAGKLDVARTARMVAVGRGERGRNIDYLQRTLDHMRLIGVRDPHLERVLERARQRPARRTAPRRG